MRCQRDEMPTYEEFEVPWSGRLPWDRHEGERDG